MEAAQGGESVAIGYRKCAQYVLVWVCALLCTNAAYPYTAYSVSEAGVYPLPQNPSTIHDDQYWQHLLFHPPDRPPEPLWLAVSCKEPSAFWGKRALIATGLLRPNEESPQPATDWPMRRAIEETLHASGRFQITPESDPLIPQWVLTARQTPATAQNGCHTQYLAGHLLDPSGNVLWSISTQGTACGPAASRHARHIAAHKAVIALIQAAPPFFVDIPLMATKDQTVQWLSRAYPFPTGAQLAVYYQPSRAPDPSLEPLVTSSRPRYVGDVRVTHTDAEIVHAQTVQIAPGALHPGDFVRWHHQWEPGDWSARWQAPPLIPPPFPTPSSLFWENYAP